MAKHSDKDKRMAAMLKDNNVVRTTQRCPQCYHIVSCESNKSRYNHYCKH